MSVSHSLGIDLGGTKLASVCLDNDGELHDFRYQPLSRSADPIVEIANLIDGHAPDSSCTIGVGVPAWISLATGAVVASPHRSVLVGRNLERELKERTGRHVVVGNDANVAAYGELQRSDIDHFGCVVVVNFGTGVGVGILRDGKIDLGGGGFAGEFGHGYLGGDQLCSCGSRGCLETALRVNFIRGTDDSASRVAKRARYISTAAIALQWIVRGINPQAIIVGGGVPIGWSTFLDDLRTGLEALIPPSQSEVLPKLYHAIHKEFSGAVGAAYFGRDFGQG